MIDTNSAVGEFTNSQSETSWQTILFFFFWLAFLCLLGAIVFIITHDRMKRETENEEAATSEDPEQPSPPRMPKRRGSRWSCDAPSSPTSKLGLGLTSLCAAVGLAFSIVPHVTCNYLDLEDDQTGILKAGIWSVAHQYDSSSGTGGDNVCYSTVNVDWFDVDDNLRLARVSAVVATSLGGLSFLVLLSSVSVCQKTMKFLLRCLWLPLVLAFAFQLATLLIQESFPCNGSDSCSIEWGGYSAITAAAYWLLAAFAIEFIPLP